MAMSEDQLSLFEVEIPVEEVLQDKPISKDQVSKILEAFERAGIMGEPARKEIIASCVVRPVASFDDLLAKDFQRIMKRIEERGNPKPQRVGSAWDTREEDTWIDKL